MEQTYPGVVGYVEPRLTTPTCPTSNSSAWARGVISFQFLKERFSHNDKPHAGLEAGFQEQWQQEGNVDMKSDTPGVTLTTATSTG